MSNDKVLPGQNTQTQTVQETKSPFDKYSLKNFDNELAIEVGLDLIAALLIFFIGKWVLKLVVKLAGRAMTKSRTDETLIIFTKDLLTFVAIFLLSSRL